MPWFGAGWLRPFQAHLLIENWHWERDEADRWLLHAWSDAMQHQGLKERGVHYPLMHERLEAMQQRFTRGAVPFPSLLLEEGVEIGVAAIGVGTRPEHVSFDTAGRVAEEPGPREHEPLQLFLAPGPLPRCPLQGAHLRADADRQEIVRDRLGKVAERRKRGEVAARKPLR